MKPASPGTDAAESFRSRLVSVPWRELHTGAAAGAQNMAFDERLLAEAAAGEIGPTLRFYGWSPAAVSLGHFQTEDGICWDAVRRRGWSVVRRPTGGRAVLHDRELTYSLVLPPEVLGGVGVRTSYAVLIDLLHTGLARLLHKAVPGPGGELTSGRCDAKEQRSPNCFALASECDTLVPQGKLVGSAQVRRGGALLQHGSILLDADLEAWHEIFGSPGRLVTLRQILGSAPSGVDVATAVGDGFRLAGITLVSGVMTTAEQAELSDTVEDLDDEEPR